MAEASKRFTKSDRLLKRWEFKGVYEAGRKYQSSFFTAFVLASSSRRPRIGITATRKIGNAVERNRARRLIREAFRRNKALVPAGIDIVVNVKGSLAEAPFREVESELLAFLKRIGGQ